MIAARRTTRFITALAFAGLMMGSSPLAPSPLAASAQTISISSTSFCAYLADAIALLQQRPPSKLRDALLTYLLRLQTRYCSSNGV